MRHRPPYVRRQVEALQDQVSNVNGRLTVNDREDVFCKWRLVSLFVD
jgi:hypothetical protein